MTPIRLCAFLLLFAVFALAQQPQSQTQNPGDTTSSAQRDRSQPPPTPAPTPQQQNRPGVNSQIQSQLDALVSGDPFLNDADVEVNVDDQNITLTGTIASEGQRQRVLQLASQYSRYRQIVDKMTVK